MRDTKFSECPEERNKPGGGKEVMRKARVKEVAVEIGTEGCVGFQPTAFTAGPKNEDEEPGDGDIKCKR